MGQEFLVLGSWCLVLGAGRGKRLAEAGRRSLSTRSTQASLTRSRSLERRSKPGKSGNEDVEAQENVETHEVNKPTDRRPADEALSVFAERTRLRHWLPARPGFIMTG